MTRRARCTEQALLLSEQAHDFYGVGFAHFLLVEVSDDAGRALHVQKAREAWTSINRLDLTGRLDELPAAN